MVTDARKIICCYNKTNELIACGASGESGSIKTSSATKRQDKGTCQLITFHHPNPTNALRLWRIGSARLVLARNIKTRPLEIAAFLSYTRSIGGTDKERKAGG